MTSESEFRKLAESLAVSISPDFVRQLKTFKKELLRANARINLISRKESDLVIDRLLADSIFIAGRIPSGTGATLLDIGSGAGFPWIPIKLIHPDLRIVSVDANRRKIEFQRSLARKLELADCEFHAVRVEELAPQAADFAIAKAVGDLKTLQNWALPHLKAGGLLLLPRALDEADHDIIAGLELVSAEPYGTLQQAQRAKLLMLRRL